MKFEEQHRILNECQNILKEYNVVFDIDKIISKSKDSYLVFIRALISFILRNKEEYSLPRIGAVMNRNHSTIISLLKYGEKGHIYSRNYSYVIRQLVQKFSGKSIKDQIKYHQAELERLEKIK